MDWCLDWRSGNSRYNVSISKICSKISKAIKDSFKKAVGVPMKQLHFTNTLVPTYPIRFIDNGNKIEKDLAKNWLRHVSGADCSDDCIHVDAQT
jgi:hypothetical protein